MGLPIVSPIVLAVSLLAVATQAVPAPLAVIQARDYVTKSVTETSWTTVIAYTTVQVSALPTSYDTAMTSVEEEIESPTTADESLDTPIPTPTPSTDSEEVDESPPPTEDSSPEDEAETYDAPSTPEPSNLDPEEVDQVPAPATEESSPTSSSPPPAETTTADTDPVVAYDDSGSSSGGSESGDCTSSSSSCKGDVTYWEGGLGACGDVVNTESENAIALPYGFMGPESNSNSYCGMTITVINPESGTTVKGTIKDKCMGCTGRSIDLTSKMFKEVTDGVGDGREPNFEWYID